MTAPWWLIAGAVCTLVALATVGIGLWRHACRLAGQVRILEALVDGTPHPIYIRDRQGRLLSCNDSYLKTFGCTRTGILGRSVTEGVLAGSEDALAYERDYAQVIADGRPLIRDRSLSFAGKTLTIYHWTLPYRDGSGQVCGVVCGWIDISERQLLLEQLKKAKDTADAANVAKSTFLATMSHEIRTPMNAMLGLLELALEHARAGRPDEASLAVAQRAGQGLLALIGDVLDIARIEAGQLTAMPEAVALANLVEDTAAMFSPAAREQGLALHVNIDPRTRTAVEVDPLRLRQVLSNLISNAIKYTPKGHVTIRLEALQPVRQGYLQVRLCVNDTGVGISVPDQQRAFTPFTQFRPTGAARCSDGAGLGLSICRKLSTVLGGHLTLHSTPGVGTNVCLALSLRLCANAPAPAPTRAAPAQLVPLRVLVVDDHPANRLVLTRQLQRLGIEPRAAESGTAALRLYKAQPFDLVIADCNMPGLDGYALTQAIRQFETNEGRARCTVMGYTANAQTQERQRCLAAGMDGCLFKPVDLARLRACLAECAPLPARHLTDLHDARFGAQLRAEVVRGCQSDRRSLAEHTCPQTLADLAHRAKGMALIVGARHVEQAAHALEQACRTGAEWLPARQALITALTALEAECQATAPAPVGPQPAHIAPG
ncbi:PAS domain-containing sensor histidine kinase [Pseudomonas typographi]|uniref:histidine kinase n=1 Tax=Pseudomonas typographi TaxID=2715964 RepID=A0ABR7Z4M2_9PSED|nr:PAS domain-containing sensor histidine kinase [Pseudomonas typographi]MBD1600338.1 response regulator [Pseudomonas typographi]